MNMIEEKKKDLISIVMEMNAVTQQIIESGGELSPQLEEFFASVSKDLAQKTDSYAFVMDRLDAEEKFWAEKAEQFGRVAKSVGNARERMKQAIKTAMHVMETDEVKGNDFRFKLSRSTPKLVIDQNLLPAHYFMIVNSRVVDKEMIARELEAGHEIAGAKMEEVKSLRKYVNRGAK